MIRLERRLGQPLTEFCMVRGRRSWLHRGLNWPGLYSLASIRHRVAFLGRVCPWARQSSIAKGHLQVAESWRPLADG